MTSPLFLPVNMMQWLRSPTLTVLVCFLFLPLNDLFAQRITYESLRMRDRQPNVFFDHLVIPEAPESGMSLVTLFRLENDFIPFRRYRGDASQERQRQFYGEPNVRVIVRETGTGNGNARAQDEIETLSWNETIYMETYEQTQSTTSFVQNILRTKLDSGRYRIESTATANGRTRRNVLRNLRIPDHSDSDIALFYFLDKQSGSFSTNIAPLMNMGNNVYFGRDYQVAIWFPDVNEEAEYKLEIHKLRVQQRDTTIRDQVLDYRIEKDNLLTGYRPEIYMKEGRPYFELQQSADNRPLGSFYVLHIPNSRYENAPYRIRLLKTTEDGDTKTIASRSYQSLWLDMPISLFNLDVAINMMRFIVDDDKLRSLRRGSRDEREKRFREFWGERDPSPDREYNELMVEYYRRIDYAFDNFTTPQNPGYETDQGKVYIRNGAPDRRERTFPPGQPAREVWHYDRGSTFVFEATTGFGDYQLIEQQ